MARQKRPSETNMVTRPPLGWAKSRDSYRRVTSKSYRCDSNRYHLLELTSPPKTQDCPHRAAVFVALRFASRDWRSLVQYSFDLELQNGLRELAAFAKH